jgi:hypothetical protein
MLTLFKVLSLRVADQILVNTVGNETGASPRWTVYVIASPASEW